jgi:transcription-repair coupling factor (superfamily II helicase)
MTPSNEDRSNPARRTSITTSGSGDALAIAELAATRAPLAVICATSVDARRLASEIGFFAPGVRATLFPDWETLPYDTLSPHQDLVSERLESLHRITQGEFDVVVMPASTALQRIAPPSYLAAYTFFLRQGNAFSLDAFRSQMTLAGYAHVSQVVSPGEYCVRGGLVDLFPMGSALPYRIDLADEEIDSLRAFDPDSQRTLYKVPEVRLLPAREFPMDEASRVRFRTRFREAFETDVTRAQVYRDVSNGIPPAGIEYYLPLFFEETGTLFDYLPRSTTLVLHQDCPGAIEEFWASLASRYNLLRGDKARPILMPTRLFLTGEQFFVGARDWPRIDIRTSTAGTDPSTSDSAALPEVAIERRADDPLHRLKAFAGRAGQRTLVVADSPGRRETMREYFLEYGLRPAIAADYAAFLAADAPLMLTTGPLSDGFTHARGGIAIVTEAELYAATARARGGRESRRTSLEGMVRDIGELRVGDPVVHIEHGVGRYHGLVDLDLGDGNNEFLLLEYANDAKLYVPVAQLHAISRYSGGPPEQAPLHTLGSGDWDRAKRKAAEQARDTAAELLNIYALRAARTGHAFVAPQHDLDAFAEGFGFEETADQAAAIGAVVEDMRQGKPMDRLICGDVGFGKTEVALRAAFVAVSGGRQVAVLAPTTLLAEQHFQTFSDRFADWPVRVVELSRFRSTREISAAIQAIGEGRADIVIGTHKLLSADVKFQRLGLVIIDEEHRFGVRQKEALKALRAEVDVLTLTATPIPRTMAMSLEGLRDLSVIATPPARRLAIKTFVSPVSPGVIREAALRELNRGGQIYYLHNDVASIEREQEMLQKLLPEARIIVAHGQMPERQLERVMREFLQQRHNLLLCSTIIETGIDIPTANTILINRADKFGLAQLHQLRGRVGRSHHQAYAYLLTPPAEALSANAKKRLEAIQMMEELGSGFYLAMHDLEIRGAGEVLGESQSGEMQEVGFNLYADMLNAAVKALKAGRTPDIDQPFEAVAEINLHVPALLPGVYCADVHERLVLYKRLANAEADDEIVLLREELIDRFGPLPPQAESLLACHRLRLSARPIGITRIDAAEEAMVVHFGQHATVEPRRLIELIQSRRNWKMSGPTRLRIEVRSATLPQRVKAVEEVLQALVQPVAPPPSRKQEKRAAR